MEKMRTWRTVVSMVGNTDSSGEMCPSRTVGRRRQIADTASVPPMGPGRAVKDRMVVDTPSMIKIHSRRTPPDDNIPIGDTLPTIEISPGGTGDDTDGRPDTPSPSPISEDLVIRPSFGDQREHIIEDLSCMATSP
jgi:hypothetical protein